MSLKVTPLSVKSHQHPELAYPPYLVIPSADFGGPFVSAFTPSAWRDDQMMADLDETGAPASESDASAMAMFWGESIAAIGRRDGTARYWPQQPYAAPMSNARWRDLLTVAAADLVRLRDWFAAAADLESAGDES